MNNFRDASVLHSVLRTAYEKGSPEERRPGLVYFLEQNGFTPAQASLYAATVLVQNKEGSADWALTNAGHVRGSWVRGEQEGIASGWLNTMKETWQFEFELTYEHKIEKYEGYSSGPSPFFQSSFSRPSVNIERGIWAPPDTIVDQLEIFVMSEGGLACAMKLEWVDNANYDYRACLIDGKRFGRAPI